jgi:hypothetical protein
MKRRRLALVLALIPIGAECYAQALPPSHAEWQPRKGMSRVFGFGYQAPDGPQVSAGVIVGRVPGKQNKCIFGATSEGALLQAHLGLNAAKVSVGAARYNPLLGYGFKVSVAHFWRTSGDTPAGATLIGPEVEIAAFMARINVGVLWPVTEAGTNRRFTWGVGLGF